MIRSLAHAYRNQKVLLAIIAALNILSAGTEALALISIAPLVEAASEGNTRYQGGFGPVDLDVSLTELAWFSAAMLIAAVVIQTITNYVTSRLTTGYRLRKRLEVVSAFQGADWSVQAQEREGWLRTLSTENVDTSADGLQNIAIWLKGAIGALVFLIGAIALNFVAVLLIIIVLGIVTLGLIPLNRHVRKLGAEIAVLNVQISEELATLTMNARELKMYGVVPAASQDYRRIARDQRLAYLRASVVEGLGAPLFRTAAALLIVAMIAVAATRGSAAVAGVGVVAVLLYRSSNYGTVLVGVQQRLARIVPIIDQLEVGLATLWSHQLPVGRLEPKHFNTVEAVSVTFHYPGQATSAVEDVSIRIGTEEIVGIVGPSGGGKSTLAELLVGLRRPSSGKVLVDGFELAELSEQARSRCVSLVSQNVPLIPGTLRENVRFFRAVDDDVIEHALDAAGLRSVVSELPDGLDTVVGPGARSLSGGQSQRVGIACALAGQPAMIVLDEPTSSLDAVAEQVVIETIGKLRGQVGIAVIAHRLTTLRHCDRIVVIEHGRLADEGTMIELRARNAFLGHAYAAGQLD